MGIGTKLVYNHRGAHFVTLGPIVSKDTGVESAFALYVGFGVLMASKLETNVVLMRYVAAISPMKDLKS